jgi:hypothetical protein
MSALLQGRVFFDAGQRIVSRQTTIRALIFGPDNGAQLDNRTSIRSALYRPFELVYLPDRADVLTERKQKVIELEPHVHVGMVHGFTSSQKPVS